MVIPLWTRTPGQNRKRQSMFIISCSKQTLSNAKNAYLHLRIGKKTGLDITLAAPRKYFRLPAPWFLWWAQKSNQKRHSQLNSQQQASAIAPALAACSPREHDISTRQPSLHIRKLNLIGSE